MLSQIYDTLDRHEAEDIIILANAEEKALQFEKGICPPSFSTARERLVFTENIPTMRIADRFSVRKHTTPVVPYFHKHRFVELLYVHKGACTQWTESLSNPQRIGEGEFMLIGPSVSHAIQFPGVDDIILKMVIPVPFLANFFDDTISPMFQLFHTPPTASGLWIHFTPAQSDTITQLVSLLLRESLLERRFQMPACKGYLGLLLVELMREGHPQISFSSCEAVHTIEQAISSLPCSEEFPTLEELAYQLGYHPGYLGRRVKEHFGFGYRQLLQKIRLKRAVELLAESDDTVEAIAFQLGYESPNSLYRLIRTTYGVSPSAFRKKGSIIVEK